MQLQEAKEKFVQAWGAFGTNWGINRTMAQVHALLLVSQQALSADDIMESLNISRGNANMNVRALIDWGLVYKENKSGERREYFLAEKDVWTVIRQIIINRKKRELAPAIDVLEEVQNIDEEGQEKEEFVKIISEIELFSRKADILLDKLVEAEAEWLMGTFIKMI
jgi:DNA-binding transcriptional regulator GbsR (MarR family)